MCRYQTFSWKDSNFRIYSPAFKDITREIVRQRALLEQYIGSHPEFRTSMIPVGTTSNAPEIALRMLRAASRVGVGPMAAVAGTIAQLAAEAGLRSGTPTAIVENGGDIFLAATQEVRVGLYAGADHSLSGRLAFAVSPKDMPVAICSSSSKMGHSDSLGDCDLATVVAEDAALADAAATLACNLVRSPKDVDRVLKRVLAIPGIAGVLLIKDARVGLVGNLPELVTGTAADIGGKVTRDRHSSL